MGRESGCDTGGGEAVINTHMARKYTQGKFEPRNPSKYIGDVRNIVFRSSWELRFLRWCDASDAVIGYTSEEVVIPYWSAVDQKMHRYFVDFMIHVTTPAGSKKYLIEVKPKEQTEPPKKTKSKYYQSQCLTYVQNIEKWKAAKEWAVKNGIEFVVMTEVDLFGAKR